MTTETILALDPAAKTGFAHSNGASGTWLITHPMDTHAGARLLRLKKLIVEAIDKWGCSFIAVESASFGSHNPAVQAMHNENAGVIKLIAAERRIRIRFFSIQDIKIYATGKGNAEKEQMMRACQTLLHRTPADDNEADAIWICELAQHPELWREKVKPIKKKKPAKDRKPRRLF